MAPTAELHLVRQRHGPVGPSLATIRKESNHVAHSTNADCRRRDYPYLPIRLPVFKFAGQRAEGPRTPRWRIAFAPSKPGSRTLKSTRETRKTSSSERKRTWLSWKNSPAWTASNWPICTTSATGCKTNSEAWSTRAGRFRPKRRGQLAKISKRYGSLFFDPTIGVSKFDTDILFDEGDDTLKPGAEDVLRKLVQELNSPEGQELKVVVVGHTDDRLIAKKPVREKYSDNFRLSTARAHAVGDALRTLGLAHERMIITGAGPHQPVAPNTAEEDRRKNRRVELFVLGPDVPVIGWTETTPSLY